MSKKDTKAEANKKVKKTKVSKDKTKVVEVKPPKHKFYRG
jgi:hypothetical protein